MALLGIYRELVTVFDDNGLPATDSLTTAGNMSLGKGGRASGNIVFNNSLLNL